MTYHRSATRWHSCTDALGRQVLYITSDEFGPPAVGLCSIYNPLSALPSVRLVRHGERWLPEPFNDERDEPYPKTGLIVFGYCKLDRPSLREAHVLDPIAAAALPR